MMEPRCPVIVVDVADDDPARRRGVHHLAVADIHSHMVHPTAAAALTGEEQQVAGTQFTLAYLATELALLGRIARQLEVGHIEVHAAH